MLRVIIYFFYYKIDILPGLFKPAPRLFLLCARALLLLLLIFVMRAQRARVSALLLLLLLLLSPAAAETRARVSAADWHY